MGWGLELRSTSTLQNEPSPQSQKQASLHHMRKQRDLLPQVSGKVGGMPGMEYSSIQIPVGPSVLFKALRCSQWDPFYLI